MDEYIGKVYYDIKKFNTHVKSLTRNLERRRQQSTDILANLFKDYKAASEKVFVEYIMRKEEEYEEGSPMTADSLMNLAANKYKIRIQRDEWNAKSESETKILALESNLMSLQKKDKSKGTVKKSKTVDSKDYWWCGALTCLCRHHPSKCEAKRKQETSMRRNLNSPVLWRQSHTTINPSRSDPKRALWDGYAPC